jgi:hypothetical protein
MIGRVFALLLVFLASAAFAAEPSGCRSFAWNVDTETALLRGAAVEAGDTALDPARPAAIALTLRPLAEGGLSRPPERKPKNPDSFAGAVYFTKADYGRYVVALSAPAWIDVIQKGLYVKSIRHSGAGGCDGIRKVVEFELLPEPFIVQLSGADSPAIRMVVAPSD